MTSSPDDRRRLVPSGLGAAAAAAVPDDAPSVHLVPHPLRASGSDALPGVVTDDVLAHGPADEAGGAEAQRIDELVDRLRRQWTRTGADIAGRLRPGVAAADLDAAQDRLGLELPAGARAWWRRIDGVDPYRSSRYRAQAPTVGPGGWVPLRLSHALDRTAGSVVEAPAPPGLLPLFARDEELLAVRLGASTTRIEQLVLADDGESYQHAWRVGFDLLLTTCADSLLAAVHWLPDAHDWVVDPFAVRALRNAHLLD